MSLGFPLLSARPGPTRHGLTLLAPPPVLHQALVPPALAAVALALAACAPDPIAWNDAQERRLAAPALTGALAPDAAADSLVHTTVYAASRPVEAATTPLLTADACPLSLRVVERHGGRAAAVWWSAHPDGPAMLWAARSPDAGRTWSAPIPVDTVDRSDAGCDRPAPSVAIDSANGYLHVAYSMEAPEGKGVFYAHQMDPRAAFERPQAIVYGDRPAATSVASTGDLVVVAYEDPNTGGRPFVSLALSRTAGHSFAERFAASDGSSTSAERPVVALTPDRAGARVALGWVERSAPRAVASTDDPRSATAALPSGVVVRVGELRR